MTPLQPHSVHSTASHVPVMPKDDPGFNGDAAFYGGSPPTTLSRCFVLAVLSRTELLLLAIAVFLLGATVSGYFAGGIDDTVSLSIWRSFVSDGSAVATVASSAAFFYLLSVMLSSWVARSNWNFLLRYKKTRALSLTPWLLSIFSLAIPFMYYSVCLLKSPSIYHDPVEPVMPPSGGSNLQFQRAAYIIDEIRFKWVPLGVLWLIFIYLLTISSMIYVTIFRFPSICVSSRYDESDAAASLSWTFKRPARARTSLDRIRGMEDGMFHDKTRSLSGGSWKSTKSTRHPTLRGYHKRYEDMDTSMLSEETGSDCNSNVSNSLRRRAASALAARGLSVFGVSFGAGMGASRQPQLETVDEEEKNTSQEDSSSQLVSPLSL